MQTPYQFFFIKAWPIFLFKVLEMLRAVLNLDELFISYEQDQSFVTFYFNYYYPKV